MTLVTFEDQQHAHQRIGALLNNGILDFQSALDHAMGEGVVEKGSQLPGSLLELIQDSGSGLATCRRLPARRGDVDLSLCIGIVRLGG